MTQYKSMPQAARTIVGSKVSWKIYNTMAEAEAAAAIARHNAAIDESFGLDFGFLVPGEISQTHEGFEVVCP